ncbi:MAG: GMC family oxidoreductase N-terminal domain-containing protein [Myxococcota bacterium]
MILRYADYETRDTFDADVVVVGTGAGGATVGAELAEAGLDVLFVEEGGYHPTSSFNPYLGESVPRLYRDAGSTVIFGRPPIPYIEGRCVGGSTVINGGMAYRAPEHILEDWRRITGDDALGPEGLAPYYDRVEDRVHVAPQHPTSIGGDNRVMKQGAERKGWEYQESMRSQEACVGSNNCVLGCPTGAKQSTLVSYMPRALGHGAGCLTEVRVDRLLIEDGRCVGVAGKAVNPRTMQPDRPVTVRGKAVVVAAGAIQTPYLMLRHRLGRPSGQLGRNFLCHPNVKLIGIFPFDVKGWQGVSQVGQVREFHDEGIVLAENFIPPGAMATQMPFIDRRGWDFMSRYNQMVVGGCLVEDSHGGRVRRGPMGMPMTTYNVTKLDHARFLKGARLLADMWFEMGAEEVVLPFNNMHVARSPDDLDRIDPRRIKRKHLELFTPHLMGTCRMGGAAEDSVIDSGGQVWDLPGCYVADASVFPTAIGVNPQITIMAMATLVASRLVESVGALRRQAA